MGVELRRVPLDWKHPTDSDYSRRDGKLAHQPPMGCKWRRLFDEDWPHAMRAWWWQHKWWALTFVV